MIKDKYLDKVIYLSVIICLIISSFYTNKALFKDISIEESNYDIYAGIGWNREYLPVNTFNNIEYFLNRDNEIHIDTESNIEVLKTYFPSIKFNITNSNNTTVEIPRLYYLGYKVREKINNKYIDIDYRYNKNGFIEFDIEKDGEVEINWIGTPLYNIVRIFRIIFTLTLLIIFINRKKK